MANSERTFPAAWIAPNGYDVTDDFVRYARPLVGNDMISLPIIDGRQRLTASSRSMPRRSCRFTCRRGNEGRGRVVLTAYSGSGAGRVRHGAEQRKNLQEPVQMSHPRAKAIDELIEHELALHEILVTFADLASETIKEFGLHLAQGLGCRSAIPRQARVSLLPLA